MTDDFMSNNVTERMDRLHIACSKTHRVDLILTQCIFVLILTTCHFLWYRSHEALPSDAAWILVPICLLGDAVLLTFVLLGNDVRLATTIHNDDTVCIGIAKYRFPEPTTTTVAKTEGTGKPPDSNIVDLMSTCTHACEFIPHTQMLRMRCISLQSFHAIELRIENNIACIADSTDIYPYIKLEHSGNFSSQALKCMLDEVCRRGLLFGRLPANIPHHNVLYHNAILIHKDYLSETARARLTRNRRTSRRLPHREGQLLLATPDTATPVLH